MQYTQRYDAVRAKAFRFERAFLIVAGEETFRLAVKLPIGIFGDTYIFCDGEGFNVIGNGLGPDLNAIEESLFERIRWERPDVPVWLFHAIHSALHSKEPPEGVTIHKLL